MIYLNPETTNVTANLTPAEGGGSTGVLSLQITMLLLSEIVMKECVKLNVKPLDLLSRAG